MPTDALLDRFLNELAPLDPLAVWAHGSLAGGDYQEGRSDLDLIAILDHPLKPSTARRLVALHRGLRTDPLAVRLHCSYLAPGTQDAPNQSHLTWAHDHVIRRPVTPVTRRELHQFGRVLHGGSPKDLLPEVTDQELAEFVVRDQRDFWRPAVDKPELWLENGWVDVGLTTFARATVTRRDGRLITKREALDLLPALGAPVEVVADVVRRRYDDTVPSAASVEGDWLHRRAELTRAYLGPAIDDLVTRYG
ncbi:nucleotidyltransferase domain-containing protein [Streptomyces sp. NBC_01239]|uniref:nucleotidyltransferase domain-containing protein n=1 Tax=Streptomyces sp. NBC_01239 TaxID=2903792 RepID=UPI00225C0EFD|nr:nucleotidyltransferase domain-containing protein [Streptomyces sp. NBC_01239]MCX4810219.1 nucleotidyltransferase domain-containing protein [Streptomyces sp. NBC_01239]